MGQLGEIHHIRIAIWRVDDGMEIDERVVTGSVLVAERNGCGRSLRGLGQIGSIEHRMSTGRSFAIRIIAHVFHVCAPGFSGSVELIRKSLDGGRIDAAVADGLTVGGSAGERKIRVDLAIVAGIRCSSLATEHGDVIVETYVAGAVVLVEKNPLRGKRLGKERSLGSRAESDIETLVFENDNEDVSDAMVTRVVGITGRGA